jgi:hypothetical protein
MKTDKLFTVCGVRVSVFSLFALSRNARTTGGEAGKV